MIITIVASSLCGLIIVLATGLGPNITFAQFPPPSPELSAAQTSASTNKACILRPSSIRLQGAPQQTEGPYFVDGCLIALT